MNRLESTMRTWLLWLLPSAALLAFILWQTDWGRTFLRPPPAESGVVAQPLTLAVLPDYAPAAKPDASGAAIQRTLFNPTRRPAPTAVPEAAKPRIQRGQFSLSGTLLVDGKATALLREVNGGKSRRVGQGESINGMVVAEIRPDRVRLVLGDESEELALKVAVGPRTTIQPAVQAGAGVPVSATATATTPAQPRDVADVLAERRRQAREAEAAAAGRPPGAPLPAGQAIQAGPQVAPNPLPPAPNAALSNDPQWQSVYQRYQQPRR